MAVGAADDRAWVRSAVEEFEASLTRYAARIVGDADRARDIVQDTFLRLCGQSRDDVESRKAEWLFTVCRNRALDVLRKEQRMTSLSQEEARDRVATEPSPQDRLATKEATSRVVSELDRLPENQREVIRLKFQNGFSYREISRITGHSVTNVGFLIHTGLKNLRSRLAESL